MKKISLLAISLFMVFSLSGCGNSQKNDPGENNEADGSKSQENIVANEEGGEVAISMVDKLKNAISSGKKMKCTYKMKNENGTTEVITYVQGDKYKTEIVLGEMKTASIFDGDAMYSWVVGQKIGTKMTMDCIDSLDTKGETETMPENIPESEEDFVSTLSEAENLSCEDAGDVDFDIPSDVTFADQCEMLKAQQKMIEGFNK